MWQTGGQKKKKADKVLAVWENSASAWPHSKICRLLITVNARGIDTLNVDYQYLDLVPKGRDENGKGPFWVRRHDEYGQER